MKLKIIETRTAKNLEEEYNYFQKESKNKIIILNEQYNHTYSRGSTGVDFHHYSIAITYKEI